jgi:hypothetical protein
MFRSQPIPGGPPPARLASRAAGGGHGGRRAMNWDRRYDSFKTWSGKLERQINHLAGAGAEGSGDDGDLDSDVIGSHRTCATSVPEVDRFYAALEGPELDQLKVRHITLTCMRARSALTTSSSLSPAVGGPGAACGPDVAVPAAVPGVGVRHLHGREQPGHPVEGDGAVGTDHVPARDGQGQPRALVHLGGADVRRHRRVRVQGRPLLRGGAARVLPPDPRQLLLRALDHLPLPGHRGAARGGAQHRGAAALALVPSHGATALPGAQDLRPVDVRRAAPAVQGGQPIQPPVRAGELRGRAARRHHGVTRGPRLLLRRRAGALRRAVRHPVPAAADQRDAAQGAPPGVLPVRGGAQRVVRGLGRDLRRRVRPRLAGRLLRRHVPVRVARRAGQLLQGVQVLTGVVGLHVANGWRGRRGHPVLHRGGQRLHQGAVRGAVCGGHAHRGGAVRDNHGARFRAQELVPQ